LHTVLAHVAEGDHFTASLKISLNKLRTTKIITNHNKMPPVIASERTPFLRMLPRVIIKDTTFFLLSFFSFIHSMSHDPAMPIAPARLLMLDSKEKSPENRALDDRAVPVRMA